MKIIRILAIVILILAGIGLGYLISSRRPSPFESLDSKEAQQEIVKQRNLTIQKAVEEGKYKCCITPPCSMCFMEANQWNNFEAGTCACDDLIAQGEEPCPQCKNNFCQGEESDFCKIN